MGSENDQRAGYIIGRYAVYDAIASGGMATVYYGRLLGPVGFARTVAIKRLHPHFASDPEFCAMFLDEARLAARVNHPNVVQTLDVVALDRELLLVMEYLRGESLARLWAIANQRGETIPLGILVAIVAGALHGLHAAHEATSDRGEPLGLVHRDVSPQNILVGTDGVPRVLDFGVAKAAGRIQTTRDGQLKGKLAYMAPEQLRGGAVTRRVDVYAAGVVLWEGLTGKRLFRGDDEGSVLEQVLLGYIDGPGKFAPDVPDAIDAITMRALERDPGKRFETAREMALALERELAPALASEVGTWVTGMAKMALEVRAERVLAIESASGDRDVAPQGPTPPASSITLTRPGLPLAIRQRRTARFAAAGAAVLAVVTAAFAIVSRRDAPPTPAPESARITQEPAAGAEPGAGDASQAPVADVPATAASAPSLALSASATLPSTRPKARPISAVAAPKDDCRVKFTVDATGHKLYKRSCL